MNVVREVILYLQVLCYDITSNILEATVQAIDTLNEMSMGSYENQVVLFDGKGEKKKKKKKKEKRKKKR